MGEFYILTLAESSNIVLTQQTDHICYAVLLDLVGSQYFREWVCPCLQIQYSYNQNLAPKENKSCQDHQDDQGNQYYQDDQEDQNSHDDHDNQDNQDDPDD